MFDPSEDDSTPALRGPLSAVSSFASRACLWVAGSCLVAMTGIILWQVFARYILNASPSWSEQAALYLLVWSVLLGAAAGVREGFHIAITAGQRALGERGRRAMEISALAATATVGLFLAVYGARLVLVLWQYQIPTLGLPRGSALLPLPVAGVLMILFAAERILAIIRNRRVAPIWS